MKGAIDLHTHSHYSDGSLSPSALIALARQQQLSAIALTDHDSVDGLEEAAEAARAANIEFIDGIEFAASFGAKEVHILGLFIQRDSAALKDKLSSLRKTRHERNLEIISRLRKENIQLEDEELHPSSGNASVTRGHFARALFKKGYAGTAKEAFEQYLSPGSKFYVKRDDFPARDAIQLIKSAGGTPVLAHPLLYKLSHDEVEVLVKALANEGVMGLECLYSVNKPGDEEFLLGLAKKYRLRVTGGSDFHGINKPRIALGTGIENNLFVPYKILEDLK